ncbi:hypothetical protein DL96DRAFT_1597665 [Flagelloscypha sp. PMI_526]|nr:hypothetical protein DL96DRAFT_1597665 [Flagelloscypha sp. PMI_526]
MRESSFAFPGQNKACVCITSQLYDRRALDTPSPLALFNSLTHLVYLTSTSPRIREIMTMDGGLERLVRILHAFVLAPPLPESSSLIFGLSPASSRPPPIRDASREIIPAHFDKAAAHRFSLAFQCLVNIGVRGSEPIRSRVVGAGTLDVVGCILEAWLVQKGFTNPVLVSAPPPGSHSTVPPTSNGASSSSTQQPRPRGQPTETREQRHARRALRGANNFEQVQALHRGATPEEIQRFWAFANANPPPFASGRRLQVPHPPVPPAHSPSLVNDPRTQRPPPPPQRGPTPGRHNAEPTRVRNEHAIQVSRSATLRPRSSTIRANGQLPPQLPVSEPSHQHTTPSPSPSPADDSDSSIQIPREEDTTSDDEGPRNHVTPRRRTSTLTAPQAPGTATPTHPRGTPRSGDAHIIIFSNGDNESSLGGDALDVAGGVGVPGGVTIAGVSVPLNDDLAMGAPPGAPGALPIVRPPNSRRGSGLEAESGTESERERDPEHNVVMNGEGSSTPSSSRRPLPNINQQEDDGRAWSDNDLPSSSLMIHNHPHLHQAQSDTELPIASSSSGRYHHSQEEDTRMEVEETPRAGVVALPSSSWGERTLMGSDSRGYNSALLPPPVASSSTIRPSPQSGLAHALQNLASTSTTPQRDPFHNPAVNLFRGPSLSVSTSPIQRPSNPLGATPHNAGPALARAPPQPQATVPRQPVPPPQARIATAHRPTASSVTGSSSQAGSGDGPYRDDDVLFCLQLLAYLSKYPHVRQSFYTRRAGFHPWVVAKNLANAEEALKAATAPSSGTTSSGKGKEKDLSGVPEKEKEKDATKNFFKVLAAGGMIAEMREPKPEKQKGPVPGHPPPPGIPRETNVFALVERFTFRHQHSANSRGGSSTATMPNEIQYWAGVIMRNACRKDDSKGGVRQCANMLCGKWESYPREFAKCRRCRKAKYCGKECQSLAWSEGHRFWCSAKSEGEDGLPPPPPAANGAPGGSTGPAPPAGDTLNNNEERDVDESERRALAALGFFSGGTPAAGA